jgi:transcriptional regulator with XRE-family HTH domain
MNISERLRAARITRGYSQKEAAARAGISQPHLSRIESGERTNPRTRKALADALDITVTVEEVLSR